MYVKTVLEKMKWNKEYIKAYMKEWRLKNKERSNECRKKWDLKNPEYRKKWYLKNKEHRKEFNKKWYLKNREHLKEYSKKWRIENPEYRKKWDLKNPGYSGKWKRENPEKTSEQNKKDLKTFREKNRNNPIYRMHQNMRSRMSGVLKGRSKSASTMVIIGCTVEELFEHLESCASWEPWMTREKYGKNGWDVDHIISISRWDEPCPLQFALCWDKSNLQPLEHIENIKKGNK